MENGSESLPPFRTVQHLDGNYEGFFDQQTQKADGFGVRSFIDGGFYAGQCEQGRREGSGTLQYGTNRPELYRYSGQWKKNKFHGAGQFLYRNDSDYASRSVDIPP